MRFLVFQGSSKSSEFISTLRCYDDVELDVVPLSKASKVSIFNSYLDKEAFNYEAIFCTNWPFLTSAEHTKKHNMFTIHESVLPGFRGCAPVCGPF